MTYRTITIYKDLVDKNKKVIGSVNLVLHLNNDNEDQELYRIAAETAIALFVNPV